MLTGVLILLFLIAFSRGAAIACIANEDDGTLSDDENMRIYNASVTSEVLIEDSDTTIHFCSPDVTFSDVTVMIANSRNVTIGSTEQKTSIQCRGNSGFVLKNVSDILIVFIELIQCGQALYLGNDNHSAFTAMLIENSLNVLLKKVHFINSNGSGLIMLNVGGDSELASCYFTNSTSTNADSGQKVAYTGALHIQVSTSCNQEGAFVTSLVRCENLTAIYNSTLTISKCFFYENNGTGSTRGGGLLLYLSGNISGNIIVIEKCEFSCNSADKGGGVYVLLQHNVYDNAIKFINTSFEFNQSPTVAGGVLVGFVFNGKTPPRNNQVVFFGCKFLNNKAGYFGGVGIYSSSSQYECTAENHIQFMNCTWLNNSASLVGAAFGASPTHNNNKPSNINIISNKLWFIKVLLKNVIISSNFFRNGIDIPSNLQTGIVYVTIPVWLGGSIQISDNNGTALDIVSTTANFQRDAQVQFKNNIASPDGSALNLIGPSAITVKRNSNFIFTNNTACAGAAIQHHGIDPHEFFDSSVCFIRYAGYDSQNVEDRHINFVFENNFASCDGFGSSIHASTFSSCNNSVNSRICKPKFSSKSCFNCLANFMFLGHNKIEVSTDPDRIVTSQNQSLLAVPGKNIPLAVDLKDELNNSVPGIYTVKVLSGDVNLDSAYSYITKREIKLYGMPGKKGMLNIRALSALRNNIEAYLAVTLQQCPPGYVLDTSIVKSEACKCSKIASEAQQYHCIDGCEESSYTAIIIQSWWMDFADENSSADYDENKLVYGYCPKDHCFNNETRLLNIAWPTLKINDTSICHPTRTGRLCSQCRESYTAHYHSSSYKCGTKTTCKWGWLLYLVSEILPVTCLFIVIILFDIKLTSGAFSGLIYFAQTIDKVLLHDTNNYFGSSKASKVLMELYNLIIQMFNLRFFQLDTTSYCLLEGAGTMDMIMFQYTTALYSLLLVVLIVALAHYCSRRCSVRILKKIRKTRLSARSTLLHGITGFLILSYSRTTSTSVNLLLSVSLYSIGHIKMNHTAVYYNGAIQSFSHNHLPYAIPAIFILSTLGLIPPLLLVAYPLCYRLLAQMKLNESKVSHFLCTLFPLEKMKPLFDSFQCSLKDEYRFFSGLYFLFRLSTLAIQATIPASGSTTQFYAAISIQSALIFGVQALCQPYKKKWHNILEAIFLFDLTAIGITVTISNIHTYSFSSSMIAFQLFLLYLPLLVTMAYAGRTAWKKINARFRCAKRREDENCEYREFNDSFILENRDDYSL